MRTISTSLLNSACINQVSNYYHGMETKTYASQDKKPLSHSRQYVEWRLGKTLSDRNARDFANARIRAGHKKAQRILSARKPGAYLMSLLKNPKALDVFLEEWYEADPCLGGWTS